MSTDTEQQTVAGALNQANPNELADLLRAIQLGTVLTVTEYDTGTVTAASSITLPSAAMLVQSCRVVTASAGTTVGSYGMTDASGTASVPPGGASAGMGVAKLSADGLTITFPANVTRVIVRYIPLPAVSMTGSWNGGATSGL